MDIPSGILDKLCCDSCKNYLSCGPIFLNYKTNKVSCGRCSIKKPSAATPSNIRYLHYETLASFLLFPCKYAKQGCPKKLLFSGESAQKHETTCDYKKRACPMLSSITEPHLKCKWVGRLVNLLHHCKISHPDKVLQNPCLFQHDFTQQMHETYLVAAHSALFILNVTITDEITYTCRLIGDEKKARLFKFSVKVFVNNSKKNKLIKDGVVVAEAHNARVKNASLVLNINNLMGVFDGASGATFKFTIEHTAKAVKQVSLDAKPEDGDAVATITHNTIYCRFQKNGCNFMDTAAEKCKKHELYFCKYLIECAECNANVEKKSLVKHYILNHGAFRAKIGQTFHIQEGYKQFCFLVSDDELYLCKYSLACYRLLLTVFSAFATDELKHYCCDIRINDPGNCYKHKLTPKIELDRCHDWNININMYNYPMWRHHGLDLCVFIGKKDEL